MTYSPCHNSPSACTRAFASSRVSTASTKCRLLSLCSLKIQKGSGNWNPEIKTYSGDTLRRQWSDYHTVRGNWATMHFVREKLDMRHRKSGRGDSNVTIKATP